MSLLSFSGYIYSEEPVLDLLIDRSLPVTAPQNMGSDICPQRGYILMRDKFETDDEIWFLLKCGKTSMHDHADKNSFSLIAYGTPMALDAGAADYNDPPDTETLCEVCIPLLIKKSIQSVVVPFNTLFRS